MRGRVAACAAARSVSSCCACRGEILNVECTAPKRIY